ncbi:group I truncated hemoglobin [Haloarchaeobius amylolyticus]|uniref:group I truncated hemoglobin n=1 Tax=Haloarchaeobius amylolyticus TaxID=1198296 RepID=UPI002271D686|nr:group 1 truncated hemoglobin [Haloarchaeobius amylolyticus]
MSTLYEQLGGEEGISAVVDSFYDRVLADDRVAHFFEDTDMQQQRAHQTQFLSSVAGGPVTYSGEEMDEAHDHLDIHQEHFEVIAELLEETMVEFDVDEDDRQAVLDAVAQYEDAIVQC